MSPAVLSPPNDQGILHAQTPPAPTHPGAADGRHGQKERLLALDVFRGLTVAGMLLVNNPGSWDKTLRERADIRLLLNHEGIPMARTRADVTASTMSVTSDDVGVLVDAPDLDAAGSPLVQSVRSAMVRGDLDQMSCAFSVTRQEWSPDYTERRILEVVGYDVSIVTYPANEDTLVMVAASAAPAARSGMSVSLAAAQAAALRLRAA